MCQAAGGRWTPYDRTSVCDSVSAASGHARRLMLVSQAVRQILGCSIKQPRADRHAAAYPSPSSTEKARLLITLTPRKLWKVTLVANGNRPRAGEAEELGMELSGWYGVGVRFVLGSSGRTEAAHAAINVMAWGCRSEASRRHCSSAMIAVHHPGSTPGQGIWIMDYWEASDNTFLFLRGGSHGEVRHTGRIGARSGA